MATASKSTPVTFKHSLSIKLNNENHLLWKQQVTAAVRGHKLMLYLESPSKPQKYLSGQDGEAGNLNLDFSEWEQQDQLLVSWLLSSMTESILTRMVGCESAFEIRTKLNIYFAAQTRAKVSQLKIVLQSIKKGSSIVNEYLSKVKSAIDQLGSVGHSVFETDHIEAIFNGLPKDDDTFVISLNSKSDSYTVEEIESLLLAQETRLKGRL